MTVRLSKRQWERAKPNLPRNVIIAKQKSKRVRVVTKAKAHAPRRTT